MIFQNHKILLNKINLLIQIIKWRIMIYNKIKHFKIKYQNKIKIFLKLKIDIFKIKMLIRINY